MTIWIFRKRLHTNQLPLIETLKRKGCVVRFFVAPGRSRNQGDVVERLPASLFLSKLSKIISLLFQDRTFSKFPAPSPVALCRRIRSDRPDLIVVYKGRIDTFVVSFVAYLMRIPIFYNAQMPVDSLNCCWRDKLATFLKLLPKIKCGWIRPARAVKRKNHFVLLPPMPPNPVGARSQEKSWGGTGCGCIKIVSVGKFHAERKRHDLLLHAVARLQEVLDVEVTFYGSGDAVGVRKLREKSIELGIEHKVKICPSVPHAALMAAYIEYDLFVIPSSDEPYSISILEAMASGLPVMCSDTNQAKDCIESGVNGLVFKSGDDRDLEKCIATIISDRGKMRSMGVNSLKIVNKCHHPDVWYAQFCCIARAAGSKCFSS